jgi:transposase InsO family protein
MADHLKAGLCVDALVMALQRRRPEPGLIHHSDRGRQGGFTWSSQRLGGERLPWRVGGVRIGRCALS